MHFAIGALRLAELPDDTCVCIILKRLQAPFKTCLPAIHYHFIDIYRMLVSEGARCYAESRGLEVAAPDQSAQVTCSSFEAGPIVGLFQNKFVVNSVTCIIKRTEEQVPGMSRLCLRLRRGALISCFLYSFKLLMGPGRPGRSTELWWNLQRLREGSIKYKGPPLRLVP
jgi:hypothetical protein